MSKIAYLTGESGSGKTTLASDLVERRPYDSLTGDRLIHFAACRLCPYVRPKHAMSTDLWLVLCEHCDLRSAFRRTILDLYPGIAQSRRPILAEATLFCLGTLRNELHGAVSD